MRTLLIAAVALLAWAAPATAATFTVNTPDDTNNAGGCTVLTTCSLREAVAAANAASGSDVISLPAGHYTLTGGEIAISTDVEVAGAGTRTTVIDGNAAGRIFALSNGNTVSIHDVTLTNGFTRLTDSVVLPGDGGAILATGTALTLARVAIVGNKAQADGGGIAAPPEGNSESTVTITDSTVAGNQVTGGINPGQGGGIYISGAASLTNVTVSGNSVSNPGANVGGGIAAIKNSGSLSATTVSMLNSTVAGNSVSTGTGGGYSGGNPGGTLLSTLATKNSIVAGNSAGGSGSDCGLTGTMLAVTSDHNLSSDSSCSFTDAGSIQNADPRLAPLADNGGPTDTRALLAGSPAINAANNSGCPAADQRGTARPQAGVCDIGAFELVFSADLAIAKTSSPNPVTAGGNVTYTITVTNNGPQPAAGVTVTDTLPAGTTLVSTSAGGACSGSPLVCTLPDLAAGASETLSVVVRTSKAGSIVNAARVSGAYADPNPANNSASVTTTVRPKPADLGVTQRASRRSMSVGGRVVFRVVLRNHGPGSSVPTLYDRPSRGLRILSVQGGGRCTGRALIRCKLPRLAAGKSRVILIAATATRPGRLRNAVSVTSSVLDPAQGNNHATATVRARAARAVRPRFTG